jgi:2-iminobutanoate/2-iminopropanoate deaminase
MKVENIVTSSKHARGFYSPAKKIDLGDSYLIFVSGIQCPKDENNSILSEDITEQTTLVFEEIGKILKNAGASFDDVIKAVIYLTDMNNFSIVSTIRQEYFKNSKPVSTMVEVNGFTESKSKIEIEVTAIIEK